MSIEHITKNADVLVRSDDLHANHDDELTRWLLSKITPGTILKIGKSGLPVPTPSEEYQVISVDQLASSLEYKEIFDHLWLLDALSCDRPEDLLRRAFAATKPGGTVLFVAPYGVCTTKPASPPLYIASLRRALDPMFQIASLQLISGHIAVVATRRSQLAGAAELKIDGDEEAFYRHERRLLDRISQLSSDLKRSGARYRDLMVKAKRIQADLDLTANELKRIRNKLIRLRPFYIGPLTTWRYIRRLRASVTGRHKQHLGNVVVDLSTPENVAVTTKAKPTDGASGGWKDILHNEFKAWLRSTATASGDEVVVMFSGTTFVQGHRANRPIRLTNVYLRRKCPVFFNYYRFSDQEPLPTHPDELLFQSPIDATSAFLEELLTADFGNKKKILFASFPHELMVRYLTLAAQHGWITVYDARDDWEEFAKVGMAKWYHPGFEHYVAINADIVSAVSKPLARKISSLARHRTVHVNSNALDPRFPLPRGKRVEKKPPIIGYFGHLTDKWFDWPLIIAAARRYPDYKFELAGHQGPKLQLPTNIELLGLTSHDELAERSRSWSLALIPFKNGPLADAVDPIKIYEYLHLGLPVLATYFPQCREYPGTTITESRDEFLERLPRLVNSKLDDDLLREWLDANTWERRVDAYSQLADGIRHKGRRNIMALLEEGSSGGEQ